MSLDSKTINDICSQVYKKFPEVKDCQPSISTQGVNQHLLIFKNIVKTSDGKSLQRTVRVVVSENGKITKMTTSR